MRNENNRSFVERAAAPAAALLLAATVAACGGGGGGGGGGQPPANPMLPPPTPITIDPTEELPGLQVDVVDITGGTGAGGAFRVGDTVSVTFTLMTDTGAAFAISELNSASIMVSGPTFNYQRVLERQTDLREASIDNGDGTYTYTFAAPIPATYLPPLNDTTSFGPADGELQGQPLLDGTYTVGIEVYKNYNDTGTNVRDPGNTTADFLFGSATVLEPREVYTPANCNTCHVRLQAHGTFRRDSRLCLLCHTAGAEDRNTPTVENGTPGVTIEWRSLIHKIHNGAHLPSVLGVGTNTNGSRNYAATPRPFRVIGFGNNVHDYSGVEFPVWPNLSDPMPRDFGHSNPTTDQGLEDEMRRGVTDCAKCHGDPDGSGPLPAPAQGDRAFTNPTRSACGSCHDDIDWSRPYSANLTTMPPQIDDTSCLQCHPASGGALPNDDLHRHPLTVTSAENPGINFDVTAVTDAGTAMPSGTIEPGERIAVTFSITDDSGAAVAAADINRIELAVSGPTTNRNLVHFIRFPPAALGAGPVHTSNVPELLQAELVGTSGAGLQMFMTSRAPHWNVAGATTSVDLATPTGSTSTLASGAPRLQNFVDVVSGAVFARNDWIVIDSGAMAEEYLRIQYVDGNRLWFAAAGSTSYPVSLRGDHMSGASVEVVNLTSIPDTDYTLTAQTGQIVEVNEFGTGSVLVTYTSDFIMPAEYPTPLNDSPDIGEVRAEWQGKSLVDGTYTVGIWGRRTVSISMFGETTTYRRISLPANRDFLVGIASVAQPYSLISSGENCNVCHNTIFFHGGGRRDFGTCIHCHGAAGSEDRPPYVAANAPPTTGRSIEFRRMLHVIHMGEELFDAASYQVIGFGSGYPNNFSIHSYEHVVFPPFPGGPRHCETCHGAGNSSWMEPSYRGHPTEQMTPTLDWTQACSSCHNSPAALAHMTTKVDPGGVEACAVCHGPGAEFEVELVHRTR